MQRKSCRCGIRSIDPIADITNYILLEFGQQWSRLMRQSLHNLFKFVSRRGEELVLLDGSTAKNFNQ